MREHFGDMPGPIVTETAVTAVRTWGVLFLVGLAYLRRETRRAVRRPVRRATLRDPNISFLLVCCPWPGHCPAAAAEVSMS